jgi:hypothetical protein
MRTRSERPREHGSADSSGSLRLLVRVWANGIQDLPSYSRSSGRASGVSASPWLPIFKLAGAIDSGGTILLRLAHELKPLSFEVFHSEQELLPQPRSLLLGTKTNSRTALLGLSIPVALPQSSVEIAHRDPAFNGEPLARITVLKVNLSMVGSASGPVLPSYAHR